MKRRGIWTGLAIFACLVAWTTVAQAQSDPDTLVVEWCCDANDDVIRNALRDAIAGDTLANGSRKNPNRVYKLLRGGFYYQTERIQNDGWHLNIVGEKGDPSDPFGNPPMIIRVMREDGTTDDKTIFGNGSVTLKNLYINGREESGSVNSYQTIEFAASDARYVIDNVIFEFAQYGIFAVTGPRSKVYVTNSKFRNLLNETQKWGGRGMSIWTDIDTLHVENNTFMNIGFTAIQVEGGQSRFTWVNQNTFVNIGRQMMITGWWYEKYFTNNLIVNGFWHAEDQDDFPADRLADPLQTHAGMLGLTTMPSNYGLDIERKIAYANNATFTEQPFVDFWASTAGNSFPLRPQPFISSEGVPLIEEYENIVYNEPITGQDPGFVNHPDNYSQMIAFIQALRDGEPTLPMWYWDPNRDPGNISVSWPLPENLTYSNSQLQTAAIGGYPLGDLNWFPSEKARWEANRQAQTEAILDLVGEGVQVNRLDEFEGESGALAGSASTEYSEDLYYGFLQGTGHITWTLDVEQAGSYTLVAEMRVCTGCEDGEGTNREQNLIINGTNVGPLTVMGGVDPVQWQYPEVTVNLNAGTNTISITPSWGWGHVKTVVLSAGEEQVGYLTMGEADIEGVQLICDGDACSSGGQYVVIPADGSATYSIESNSATHLLKLVYIADGGATVDVLVNGERVSTEIIPDADDWATFDIGNLPFRSGANLVEIKALSGTLQIDKFDVFVFGMGTSIDDDVLNPDGFRLSQNYPNPFNPTTNIEFNLPQTVNVRLTVHNILGQTVAILADGLLSQGVYTYQFDAKRLASGVYFYRLQAGNQVLSRKMTLIK